MLSAVAWLLGATALLAGLTGAWSPCGFSMVDTLAAGGARRRATLASCATFAAGALLGGAATFVALSALGAALRGVGAAMPGAFAAESGFVCTPYSSPTCLAAGKTRLRRELNPRAH